MRFYPDFSAAITGLALTSALVVVMPQAAHALTGAEVNDIARDVTVLIHGDQDQGTGVIIARNDDTYYVLTNYHVVVNHNDFKVVTSDQQAHVMGETVQDLPGGVDLAIIQFTSETDYPTATLSAADLTQGQEVFVSGWTSALAPQESQKDQSRLTRQFTDGGVSTILDQPVRGYQVAYTNVTRPGMSGGPVFDTAGRVVAIHGLGGIADSRRISALLGLPEQDASTLAGLIPTGFNYSIPITTYLQLAPQAGLYLNVQVETTPPVALDAPYVASTETDPRDQITDINNVIDTVDRGVGVLQEVCGFFGC